MDKQAGATLRAGTYNIRTGWGDGGTPNAWENRRADLADFMGSLALDVVGLQEVLPEQAAYLRERLPEFAWLGEHRGADRCSDEASPIGYRRARFTALQGGTFWLSETPEVPGSRGWGAACPRVCSWALLRDQDSGREFCFANAHTDHVSETARKFGMLLAIRRMREIGAGVPVVFVGDHNCTEIEEPARAVAETMDNALHATRTPPQGSWRTWNGWVEKAREVSAADMLALPPEARDIPAAAHPRLDAGGAPATPAERRYLECGGLRIDFIYVSRGVTVLDCVTHNAVRPGGTAYHSDHFPVTATLIF